MDFLISLCAYLFTRKKMQQRAAEGKCTRKEELTIVPISTPHSHVVPHAPLGEGRAGGGEDYFSEGKDGF